MTQQQKLTKVIERAVERGYGWKYDELPIWRDASRKIYVVDREGYNQPLTTKDTEFYKLIFSHDFAKAYWGENKILVCELSAEIGVGAGEKHRRKTIPMWQYHLQQAALSKDPITYYHDND